MDNFHDPKPTKAAAKKTVNSVLGRVARAGNSILSLMSGLLAASLILYSGFVLYDNFYTHTNAGNTWELAQYRPEVVVEDGLTPLSGGASLAVVNKDYLELCVGLTEDTVNAFFYVLFGVVHRYNDSN